MSRPSGGPVRRDLPLRRLVLTGGGTGGHLYPAVSIARACSVFGVRSSVFGSDLDQHRTPNTEHQTPNTEHLTPVFIGTRTGIEAEVVAREGFEFHAITSRKVRRTLTPGSLLSLAAIAWGTMQAALLLQKLRPVAVIGTGGYASAGVVLAAALQGIPTLIHEQNSVPGRTNRLLGRLVRRVALTFEESASYFPSAKSVVTGLPVRPGVLAGQRERSLSQLGLSPDRFTLLVLGGSLGARSLNRAVLEALPHWSNSGLQIVHQVGRGNWDAHRLASSGVPDWYRPVPYLEAMGDAYAAADLVLCRAGASTLAELAMVGLPAILVPYPHAHADHQTMNARIASDAGAAAVLADSELSGERLAALVAGFQHDTERRGRMAAASRQRARPEAAADILGIVGELMGGERADIVEPRGIGTKQGAA